MKFQLNLLLGWLWLLLGFIAGLGLGLGFHRENWLGGYASFKRRMYRLAHISFFGLGTVNLLFWLTMKTLAVSGLLLTVAAWAFIVGAITMPAGCVLMAHFPKAHMIFAVPVISLLAGAGLTLAAIVRWAGSDAASRSGQRCSNHTCSYHIHTLHHRITPTPSNHETHWTHRPERRARTQR